MRLHELTCLVEAKNVLGAPKLLFHGSIHTKHEFSPLTHFGTLRAAIERLATRGQKVGTVYPVSLAIHNPVVVSDGATLSHTPIVFAWQLSKKGILTSQQVDEVVRADFEDTRSAPAKLCDMLLALGYDGLRYKNRHEDAGSTSWCNCRPDQVAAAGKPMTFTQPEMEALLDGEAFDTAAILKTKQA